MAYTYARRVELAAQKLAAAGIRRQAGVDAYRQWKALPEAARAAATISKVRTDPRYRPGGVRARLVAEVRGVRRAPLRSVNTPAGSLHHTGNAAVVTDLLRQAEARGHLVAFKANFITPDGQSRTRIIDGSGDQDQLAGLMVDAAGGRGALAGGVDRVQRPLRLDAHTATGRRTRPGIEVRIGATPGTRNVGLDPSEVLALIRATGSVWAAIYLLWAISYEQ